VPVPKITWRREDGRVIFRDPEKRSQVGLAAHVELFAQVRSNGRILDNIRHVLGGSILLEGGFSFKKICRREDLAGWTANFTMRPRNITLRKGMLTSLWTDVSEMIAARNMDVMDNNGTSVSAADFLRTS